MCGICGFISKEEKVNAGHLLEMTDAIRHRGPDDEGYALVEGEEWRLHSGKESQPAIQEAYTQLDRHQQLHFGLGFRRLSIMDLSHRGHQPMVDAGSRVALTFNGEIYNYRELQAELKKAGFRFESGSDTEVILKGYLHWGIDVIHRLNGMFAFAIADLSKNKLWLVRDRIGIKPLFYHNAAGKFSWASEMKGILQLPWVRREIDFTGLTSNYLLQTTVTPLSCFKNISSIRPGHFLEIALQTMDYKEVCYWRLPQERMPDINPHAAADQVHLLLQQAVQRQLTADVPVVSLMSGGIDSTTITALAARQDPAIQSYTMGFDATGSGADELPQARAMAEKLGIRQNIHLIKPDDITDSLLATLEHYEEPYSSLETVVEASRFIHLQDFKVALNGNGADELFGGYSYVLQLKKWQQRRKMSALEPLVPAISPLTRRIKNYLGLDSVFRFFMNSNQGMRVHQAKELGLPEVSINELLRTLPVNEERCTHDYEALFQYDMRYSVASHHVYRDDMSAMRYSLEMRYPYLDHELIEYVARLPLHLRYNGLENKPLLRRISKQYILSDNLSMPKKGFSMPGNTWMKDNAAIISFAEGHIEALLRRDLFNKKTIKKWWQERNQPFTFPKIWQLVTTEVWLRKYID